MRILAASDMHGNLDVVLRAVDEHTGDLMLSAGDWGDPGEISLDTFRAILDYVPVMTVYGNHDDMDLLAQARNKDGSPILLPQGRIREFGGLRFAGIGGIWAKSHRKPYYVTDEEVRQMAERLAGQHVDVLVTHGCAIGLADSVPRGGHGGQRCFLDAFHIVAPRLYICGHLHLSQQRILKDGRIIINTGHAAEGDYWAIDVTGDVVTAEHHAAGTQET